MRLLRSGGGGGGGGGGLRLYRAAGSNLQMVRPSSMSVVIVRAREVRSKSLDLAIYSGTPLNGHPSKADTHDITDNSESPDCLSIHFNT